jgi:hypothetical protein
VRDVVFSAFGVYQGLDDYYMKALRKISIEVGRVLRYDDNDLMLAKLQRILEVVKLFAESGHNRFVLVIDDDPSSPDNLITLLAWEKIRHMICGVVSLKSFTLPRGQRTALVEDCDDYISFSLCEQTSRTRRIVEAISKIKYKKKTKLHLFKYSLYKASFSTGRTFEHPNGNTVDWYCHSDVHFVPMLFYPDNTPTELAASSAFAQITGIKNSTVSVYSDFFGRGLEGGLEFLLGKRGRFQALPKEKLQALTLDRNVPIPMYESPDDVSLIENYNRDEHFLNFSASWYLYPRFNRERTGPHEMHEVVRMSQVLYQKD